MSDFERVYQIDPSREAHVQREKHASIELYDREYLEKKGFILSDHHVKFNTGPKFDDTPLRVSKEMEQEGWVYKEPPSEQAMSPALKEKFKKARKICQETKIKTLTEVGPPPIPMKLEMPELEKAIRKGKNNEKSTSETPKKKASKANSRANKSAMENLQA